ncbi:hypothetical protein SMC6_06750 [Candidatus Cryosericum odellii]|uniref:Uncharacterized protein n=1 Tax=Candidatus Cryosericum odellii TaxID=2290917 RepID=A0A398D1R5_9BACT|nr:hypothetical protein SMC6_06750 [Candidatus Cryosericum odellii]RIE08870.1 hypothetical protein SMC5_07610 [Candidatus Cryosericum odellii]
MNEQTYETRLDRHSGCGAGRSSGWHEETIDGLPTSCWHSGICDTFYTYVFLQPSRDIGVILFANAAGDNNATQAMFTELSKIAALYAAP